MFQSAFSCSNVGSQAVSQLALTLRPRYHYAGTQGVFYERQPYRNHVTLKEPAKHVTRFLGLANVANKTKEKVKLLLLLHCHLYYSIEEEEGEDEAWLR